jgi:hypothetical protein
MTEKKTVYSRPVLEALKAAADHPEKRLGTVSAEIRDTIASLGITDNGVLNERGRNVTAALAAAGWKR